MNFYKAILLGLGLVLLLCTISFSQPYAIPEAMGFAKNVRGAYSGSANPTILYVDRLTDDSGNNGSNKGSLRWCLTRSYPRIILFEVSGYINLKSYILVTSDYVSIYGQTAPSPGITISGINVVDLRCNYVVMQHLRFRSSYVGEAQLDALTIYKGSNVFIDHCSFSYAEDECLGIGGSNDSFTGPLTIQNCIFSNGLNYNSSKAILAKDVFDNMSIIRTAFVHCALRTPLCGDNNYTAVEALNTVSYNCHYWGSVYERGNNPRISIIGNEWRSGPNSNKQREVIRINSSMSPGSKFYLKNNYSLTRKGASEWNGVASFQDESKDSSYFYQATPFQGYETNYYPYTELNDSLTAHAGARPWDRDSVDIVALNDMVNGTGSWITNQSEAYYPKLTENKITLDIPDTPHEDSGNGYTNLEMWVYKIANNVLTANQIKNSPSGIFIYPNPVNDFLILEGMSDGSIEILNISGHIISQNDVTGDQTKIDVSCFKPGIYIVKFKKNGKVNTLKFIKQ